MKNNQEVNQKDLANTDNIAFDGDETVNFYSKVNYGRSDSPNSNKNLNKMNLNSTPYSEDSNNSNSKTGDTNKSELNRKNSSSNRDSYDLTMRLRYLEKSIKFIQQQHNETLNSLHQEIEKLKNENRGNILQKQDNFQRLLTNCKIFRIALQISNKKIFINKPNKVNVTS